MATSTPPSAAAATAPSTNARVLWITWHLRPHHRLLLRPCLVGCIHVRLWLIARSIARVAVARSVALARRIAAWVAWPTSTAAWPTGSSVAIPDLVCEPLPLVAGSGWHLRQPPRRRWRAGLLPILVVPSRTWLLGRVPGGDWNLPRVALPPPPPVDGHAIAPPPLRGPDAA